MGKRNTSHFLCPRTAEKLVAEKIKQTHDGVCLSVPFLHSVPMNDTYYSKGLSCSSRWLVMEGSMGLTKAIRAVCRMELGPDTQALPTVMALIPLL